MSRLTRDGTAAPFSRDQILRREWGHGNVHFSCPADHEQDWQPNSVDPYSCYSVFVITIHTSQQSTCFSFQTHPIGDLNIVLDLNAGHCYGFQLSTALALVKNVARYWEINSNSVLRGGLPQRLFFYLSNM